MCSGLRVWSTSTVYNIAGKMCVVRLDLQSSGLEVLLDEELGHWMRNGVINEHG
jgi:hypothetical protein